ncbi:DUF1534 domain-containing protein [Pseudomonas syringae pv. actinidiae]|nr:DUF1534 domain-containing protein [Pseudomonas syringae pv. actinidiae]
MHRFTGRAFLWASDQVTLARADAERRTTVEITACRRGVARQVRLSLPTLQRGNALHDALRHKSVPHCTLKRGRRASRTALSTQTRRTIILSLLLPQKPRTGLFRTCLSADQVR